MLIAEAAQVKKAKDVIIMDMRKISNATDFFVICSGTSTKAIEAIAEGIIDTLEKAGTKLGHIEGGNNALWVLLDYGDAIVHIFYSTTREFYNLEGLWGDASTIRFEDTSGVAKLKNTGLMEEN